jgi:hypothetical protein
MSMLCAHTGAIELTELPEQSPDARICCFDARVQLSATATFVAS